MKYVVTRGGEDCGIACLAMLTGISYERAAAILPPLGKHGIDTEDMDFALSGLGYWTQRRPGPHMPFAAKHLLLVRVNKGDKYFHYVAMDRSARVFDPNPHYGITAIDVYRQVRQTIGLFRHPITKRGHNGSQR